MRGCNDRAALSSSEAYHAHGHMRGAGAAEPGAGAAAAGPTGDGNLLASLGVTAPLATPGQLAAAAAAGQAGGGDPPVQQQQQQQKQMWGLMGFGGLFIDNYQLPPDPTDTQVIEGSACAQELLALRVVINAVTGGCVYVRVGQKQPSFSSYLSHTLFSPTHTQTHTTHAGVRRPAGL